MLLLATFGLLALHAWRFESAQAGTSAEYWENLCGVQLPAFKGHHEFSRFGGTHPVVDGQAYYYAQMHHESLLYSVPVEEVLRDVSNVQELLTNPPPSCEENDRLCRLYKKGAGRRSECAKFLGAVNAAAMDTRALEELRLAIAKTSAHLSYDEGEDAAFRERLGRAKRVWATFAFEGLYLSAWLMFVLGLPPLRTSWPWRVACAPFLLFLPFFLGYAPMTFTFGPSGGFVYPVYLTLASVPMQILPCSALDGFFWELFPQVLFDLSQVPGAPMAASTFACVGPVSSLAFGLLLLAIVWGIIQLVRRLRFEHQSRVG